MYLAHVKLVVDYARTSGSERFSGRGWWCRLDASTRPVNNVAFDAQTESRAELFQKGPAERAKIQLKSLPQRCFTGEYLKRG